MRIHSKITPIRIFSTLICTIIISIHSGCGSDDNIVSEEKHHPEEWTNINSEGFHGKVGLSQGLVDCLGCHGQDLSGGEEGGSCFQCHGDGKDNCGVCHGNPDDSSGAPPFGLRGEIDDSILAVGAHQSHEFGSTKSDGIECSACHIVPAVPWDSAHFDVNLFDGPGLIDSIAEITWSGLAGSASMWNRTERICSGTYCHGNFPRGNTDNVPIWTEQEQSDCGTCHADESDLRPIGRNHIFHNVLGFGCHRCHASTVDSLSNIIGPEFHVDGSKTIMFSPDIGSFSDSTCFSPGGCHGNRAWY